MDDKRIDRDQYPWSHLYQEVTSELPVNQSELLATHQSTQAELLKQTQIVQQQRDRLTEMQSISTKTFDILDTKIKDLTKDNRALANEVTALKVDNEKLSTTIKDRIGEIGALEKKLGILEQISELIKKTME